jgi:hypothetical protein
MWKVPAERGNPMRKSKPETNPIQPLATVAIVAMVALVALTAIDRSGEVRPALFLLGMTLGLLRGPAALRAVFAWWKQS